MTALLAAILNSLLPSLALVAALEVALRIARPNASTRFAARWIALAAILVIPFASIEFRRSESVPFAPAAADIWDQEPYAPPVVQAPPAPAPERPVALPLEAPAALWLAVALALLARVALGYAWLRRTRRRAIPLDVHAERFAALLRASGVGRRPPLLESSEVRGPILAGFRRPAVLVPQGLPGRLSPADLDHVLLHEIAHLRRRDTWLNLLARVTGALLWFHPAVVWILRLQEQDREMACDEWVVESTGAERPYVDCLARLTEMRLGREGLLEAGVLGRRPSIARRIESLVKRRRPIAARISWLRLVMLAITVVLLAGVGATVPAIVVAEDPPAAPEPAVAPQAPEPALAQAPARAARAPRAPRAARATAAPEAPAVAVAPAPAAAPAQEGRGFLAGLAAAGYTDLSVDEIIELKNNGVDPRFIAAVQQTGFGKLSPRELIELRINGLRPSVFAEIHALGFGPYTPREAIDMTHHGIRASMFAALKGAGITRLSAREAIEAARYGLSAADIVEAREFGTNLGFSQIMKLKKAGVI